MLKTFFVTACALFMFSACSNENGYPSPDGAEPPYILKQDCKFSIIGEQGARASVKSPVVTGSPTVTASMSVSLGQFSITVADCKVTENNFDLPIYEK